MMSRSASSQMLSSLLPASARDLPPDHHAAAVDLGLPRSRSASLSSPSPRRMMTMTRARSESALSDLCAVAAPKDHLICHRLPRSVPLKEIDGRDGDRSSGSLSRLLSSSGLDGIAADRAYGCCVAEDRAAGSATTMVGGGGGRIGGGAGGGGSGGDAGNCGFGFSDSSRGGDAYYLEMIEASPANSLLLGNYARYLKEVRNDSVKAQEYCERAILVDPGDADALSLYADLIWQTSKDAERAEGYFDRAVRSAPEDCFVMASYARFLWDAEEEAEEEEEEEEEGGGYGGGNESRFFPGVTSQSITAQLLHELLD